MWIWIYTVKHPCNDHCEQRISRLLRTYFKSPFKNFHRLDKYFYFLWSLVQRTFSTKDIFGSDSWNLLCQFDSTCMYSICGNMSVELIMKSNTHSNDSSTQSVLNLRLSSIFFQKFCEVRLCFFRSSCVFSSSNHSDVWLPREYLEKTTSLQPQYSTNQKFVERWLQ